jgi:hypothetical protein
LSTVNKRRSFYSIENACAPCAAPCKQAVGVNMDKWFAIISAGAAGFLG